MERQLVEALKIGTYKRVGCMMKKYSEILNYLLLYVTKSDFLIGIKLLSSVYVFIFMFFRQGLSGLPTVRSIITSIALK